jgi:hypothetical protein
MLGVLAFLAGHAGSGPSRWGTADSTFSAWRVLQQIPLPVWQDLWPLAAIASASLLVFATLSAYLILKGRERLAAITIAAAMIPTGLAMIDGVARMAPCFSLAEAARFLNERPGVHGQVIYEGALHQGSSLVFYLRQKFYLVNPPPSDDSFIGSSNRDIVLDENTVLTKWADPEVVYLIIDQDRVPHWQKVITDKFHIFHQVTATGTCVVLSNEL